MGKKIITLYSLDDEFKLDTVDVYDEVKEDGIGYEWYEPVDTGSMGQLGRMPLSWIDVSWFRSKEELLNHLLRVSISLNKEVNDERQQ